MRRLLKSLSSYSDELVLAFIAFFLFFVATNTQTGWLFVVSALLLGVLAVNWFSSRSTLLGLEVRALDVSPVFAGQKARLRLELHNPGRRERRFFTVSAGERPVLVSSLPALSRVQVEVEVDCPRRGVFPIPPVALFSATPFGLFGVTRRHHPEGELIVFPRGPVLERSAFMQSAPRRAYHQRTHNRSGSSYDLRRIRPYEPGEDIRGVHWPLTARTGQLMVREHQETSARRLNLVVLNGSASGESLESAVMAAASLIELALREGLAVRLVAGLGGRIVERTGNRAASHYELLARLGPERLEGSAILSGAAEKSEAQGTLLILAASPVDQKGWDEVRRKRIGATVLAFHAGPHAVPVTVKMTRLLPESDLAAILAAR